jgi:pimeloyl-ACP methyl ester carboxylesterase
MASLNIDGVELYYQEQGAGPVVVFLHGLGSSSQDWEFQFQHFSKAYRCVGFDLPGSGQSKDPRHLHGPFSVQSFARTIATAMKQLGLAPAHVVGLSMGGMTGLQLALDAPEVVRTLTVVNATASVQPTGLREKALLGVRKVLTRTLGPRGVALLVAPRLFPKPQQEELRTRFIENMATLDRRTYAAVSAAVMAFSVEDRVHQLRCPLLLIASDGDYTPVALKEALVARVRGAKLVVVPDAHHALPIENPPAFEAVLEPFLAQNS